jgi:hypothetical protein
MREVPGRLVNKQNKTGFRAYPDLIGKSAIAHPVLIVWYQVLGNPD